jgi:hypothetical protein
MSGMRHKIREFGNMVDDPNVHKFVDYVYSGKFDATYWRLLKDGSLGVDRETFLQEILNSDRSDKDIYRVIMQVHTEVTDDTILGDNTPAHLYHVPTLIEWFPQAKILHTFRDPRAILEQALATNRPYRFTTFISKHLKPLYSLITVLHVTVTWLYAVRLHHQYKKRYPQNYYLSKFEDLVNEPEKHIRELCEFLDIEFDSEMLNPWGVDSSYLHQGGAGFDKQVLTVWQDRLKPWMKAWLLFWVKKHLKDFGYIC